MFSWFNFSSTRPPVETSTDTQISTLENTISNLDGTVDGLKTLVLKLAKKQRVFQQQLDALSEKEETETQYVPSISYRYIIDILSNHMSKTQFENYTTLQDMNDFEREFGFKPKSKLEFGYCFLMTIARKALQKKEEDFEFILKPSNKISIDAISEFTSSNRIKYRTRNAWDDFLCDYQYSELLIT